MQVKPGFVCVLLQLAQFPCRSASATPLGSITSVVEQPQSSQQSSTLAATTVMADSHNAELKGSFSAFFLYGSLFVLSFECCMCQAGLMWSAGDGGCINVVNVVMLLT
jgi:hypothetical protein